MLFAVLAGASAAAWTICLKLGAARVTAPLGAMVITSVAFVVNVLAVLGLRARGHPVVVSPEAVWLLALAGVAAAGVDVFGLLAYERGLRLTSSLIIGGTATALVLLAGFLALREPVTWTRLLALGLIATGIVLIQLEGN